MKDVKTMSDMIENTPPPEKHRPGALITAASPWIDGRQVSYGTLSTWLGVSRQAARMKYMRLMDLRANSDNPHPVTIQMMRDPIVDPQAHARKLQQAAEEYALRVAQQAWRWGPTRTSITLGIPVDEVKRLTAEAESRMPAKKF